MMGKGSVGHNTRAFTAKNVDKERSSDNICFCNKNIKTVYHQLFDKSLERFNAKQKRSDRKINNYYEKIRQGKQEKLFYEVIFQIGNKDDMNAKSEEGRLAKEILSEFMEKFAEHNPNLSVFSANLHMDEETPHLHIDFIPFIRDSKRGLDTRVSLKGALKEQGFPGGTRGATEWNQWIESEKKELAAVMGRYGIRWHQKGTHEKHLSVLEFEKQERSKEVSELEQKINSSVTQLHQVAESTEAQRRQAEQLKQDNQKLSNLNRNLQNQNSSLQSDIELNHLDLKISERKLTNKKEEFAKVQREVEFVQELVREGKEDLKLVQGEYSAAVEKTKIAEELREMLLNCGNSREYELFERVVNLQYENQQLKEENSRLKESLRQAYDFMKQFVIGGMNLLERFIESVGEKVQRLAAELRR